MPRRLRSLFLAAALLLSAFPAFAQKKDGEDRDSLVMLLSARSAQLTEERGEHFRKVFGPARFLHNGTFLLCDTAYWNLDRNLINAFGNVKILQDETVLTSDKLDYIIDEDRAEFRGTLVQLSDKEGNLLRTRFLDFNTKDSVAVFQQGGAMRDHEGQIIESIEGTYDARIKVFTFVDQVNMFTDSVFVQTTRLIYDSNASLATFPEALNAWQGDNMLSSGGGWYDRPADLFFFEQNVHGLTPTQEAWSDSLYFDRLSMTVNMYGNAQVSDSTRNAIGMAGHIAYQDSLSHITLTREPLIRALSESKKEGAAPDTTWIGGDRLIYYTLPMFAVDSAYKVQSERRVKEINVDAVTEYRRRAAEAAEKARQDAEAEKAKQEGRPPVGGKAAEKDADKGGKDAAAPVIPSEAKESGEAKESDAPAEEPAPETDPFVAEAPQDDSGNAAAPQDDNGVIPSEAKESGEAKESSEADDSVTEAPAPADSVAAQVPAAPLDSTRVGFLFGHKNVRIYRPDMQVVCDSLAYSDLDSLVRMYERPVIWNEPNRQFSADSIAAIIRHDRLERASLMSNAFVAIQEDSLMFDQIRGTEMMAYFDTTSALQRFDALGGANALFYLEENDALATVNVVETKMLSAVFSEGVIDRIYYFEGVKNDAYPVVQLPKEQRELKGFEWRGAEKPTGPASISPRKVRASERHRYESFPEAEFKQTNEYFPGYMADVRKQIAENERRRELRREQRRRQRALADSLAKVAVADSLALADSLATLSQLDSLDALRQLDSLSALSPADSLVQQRDSLLTQKDSLGLSVPGLDSLSANSPVKTAPTKADLKKARQAKKAREKAAREKKRKERIAKREAKWAELDKRDAEKAAAKEAKKKERLRKRNERVLRKIEEDAAREQRLLEKYMAKYERQKAREEARKRKK